MGNPVINIILFAIVALFLVYRLWSVLGRRTGTERPPQAPPGGFQRRTISDKVVPLPARAPVLDLSPQTDGVEGGLARIRAVDRGFRAEGFVGGARHAFEMIVKAFADGDTATLRPLLNDDVYHTFADIIRQRLAAKESVDCRIARMEEPELVEARLDGRMAIITVKFVSSQIYVTRAADNRLIEGDPERAAEHTDFWTFSRDTRSSDPNWTLVGTGAAE